MINLKEGEIMVTQEEVREKLIKRAEREKQTYIAKQIGVPKQLISDFKLGKKKLWESTLLAPNEYLDSDLLNQQQNSKVTINQAGTY